MIFRRVRRSAALAVLVSFVTASAHQARAADAPMSNEMKAEQLFRAGEKNYDSGKYAEACTNFQDSLRIGPKLGTLLNLALCHETVGKLATAWSEFHYAAAWAAQNNQKDRQAFAIQHLRSVEMRLPRVSLQLPVGAAIATVDIDGEPLAENRWYLPLFLDPGEHSVAVTAPGKKRGTATFRVIDSPTEQLVSIQPLQDDDGTGPPPKPGVPWKDHDRGRRTAGYVLLGTGAGAFAVGLGFGLVALSASDADVKSPATVSTVAFAVAGAAAGTGLWFVLSSRPAAPAVGVLTRPGGLGFGLSAPF